MTRGLNPLDATKAIDRHTQREWQKKYSPKAVQMFAKPAITCTLCGTAMHIHPKTGQEYVISSLERKWSTHDYCMDSATNELDRSQNIGSTRD